jgi:hypothetical protein
MTEHDRFAHDDAAYVLGALSAEESAAFEAHLATCMICQDAVAEISELPALLAGVTEADLPDTTVGSAPPDTLLPSLLRAARRQRMRRRWVGAAAAGLAAAAIVSLSVALVGDGGTGNAHAHSGNQLAMTALVSSPVEATAQLQDAGWGTQITLDCTYHSSYTPDVSYHLVVHDTHGATTSAGSWQLSPGRTTHFVGGTSVRRSDIASIDIVAGATPILTLRL